MNMFDEFSPVNNIEIIYPGFSYYYDYYFSPFSGEPKINKERKRWEIMPLNQRRLSEKKTRTPRVVFLQLIHSFSFIEQCAERKQELLVTSMTRTDNHENKIYFSKVILYPVSSSLDKFLHTITPMTKRSIISFFFWLFFSSLMKGIINCWRRDTTTYLSVYLSPPPLLSLI